jgi:hypothetical protein
MGLMVTILSACYASADMPMPDEKPLQPTPSPRVQRPPTENEQFWLLPGDLGTTQIFTGTLATADDNSAVLLVQMSGLGPGSPSSSSRSVKLTLICEEGTTKPCAGIMNPSLTAALKNIRQSWLAMKAHLRILHMMILIIVS